MRIIYAKQKDATRLSLLSFVAVNVLTMAERLIVTEDEFNDIFGASDEEIDFEGFSNIDVSDFEDEIDGENVETVKENAEDWTNNVGIRDDDGPWIEKFIGRQQLNFVPPENPKALDLFSVIFTDVLNFEVYLGKEPGRERQNGLGYDVVMNMTEPFWNKNHHVYFDNFFSSPKLLEDLLERKTYACSTVCVNRKGLPSCAGTKLKPTEIVCSRKNHLLFTKWHDKRDVSVLSTNCDPHAPRVLFMRKDKAGKEKQIVRKPRVIQLYNEHMGGVDLADQLRSYYPVARSSTHWYKYIFWYLFDVSICNSFLLSKMLPIAAVGKPKTQLDFRLELATQLIGNFSSRKRSIAAPVVG